MGLNFCVCMYVSRPICMDRISLQHTRASTVHAHVNVRYFVVLRQEGTFTFQILGWSDADSGVKDFELLAFRMFLDSDSSKLESERTATESVTWTQAQPDFPSLTLTNAGQWVLLQKAGKYEQIYNTFTRFYRGGFGKVNKVWMWEPEELCLF